MRKQLILALLSLGMATFAPAGQRGTGTTAALPPAMHAMPAAPVAGGHAAPMHAPAAAHPAPHPGTPGMTPALPHRSTTHTGHTGNSQTFHNGNAGRTVRNNFCSSQPLNNFGANPTPGFGFDYEHFFAVHPNWNTCSQFSGPIVPWFGYGGGGYYPVPNNAESPSQQTGQENASNEQPDSNRLTYAQESAASSRSNSTYTPSEPVAEYVFVKRDGSTFNAVAYILLKDKIQYVTKEGLRRSIAIDSLDLDATQKSNEDRGNIVTLPGHRA